MIRRPLAFLAAALLLTACGTDAGTEPAGQETPHGYVEGAEETAEAQSRLVLADGETGEVRVLDLITEETVELDRVDGVEAVRGDGRYAYLTAGEWVHVVDSGGWMVDHGDHVHYYRAQARYAGTTEPEPGVPYRDHVLVAGADGVEVRDESGEVSTTIDEPCPHPGGTAVTRRGVVFGCADGALLVAERDGTFTATRIAYPATDAEPAREFRHRRLSTTLVADAGQHGVWLLDVTARTWTLLPTGPVVAANTAGEGTPLLTLTRDGVLRALDPETGAETARVQLLAAPLAGTAPVIEVDPSRAYVNDAASGTIYEIDYNDDLRVARTFPLDIVPTFMVETGR